MIEKTPTSTFHLPSSTQPLIAIVGQTASGKSDMAMKLARQYGGEIICADSRTIYTSMDIGTAKPSKADQEQIAHHGLDLILPSEVYSAAEFKSYSKTRSKEIRARNKLPIIAGGTGLYVDGFLYDYQFGNKANPKLRQELDAMSMNEIHQLAEELAITETDINFANRRHLQRAIERGGMVKSPRVLSPNVLLIGLQIDNETLAGRIADRVEWMFEQGFLAEVKKLVEIYGTNAPGLLAPGYRESIKYLDNSLNHEEHKRELIKSHVRLSKRQRTWFKCNNDIQWVNSYEEADMLIKTFFATME